VYASVISGSRRGTLLRHKVGEPDCCDDRLALSHDVDDVRVSVILYRDAFGNDNLRGCEGIIVFVRDVCADRSIESFGCLFTHRPTSTVVSPDDVHDDARPA